MGRRGVAPNPTALRLLHGARPARINNDEPIPDMSRPQCPAGTTDEVREIWDYAIDQLAVMGTVSMADRDVLLCYCEAVVVHRQASAILATSPVILKGVRNPAVSIQRDAAATIKVLAREFGFTPSARSEIHMAGARTPSAAGADRYLTG